MTQLRIDADFIAYRAAQRCEMEVDWGEHLTTVQSDKKETRRVFEQDLAAFRKRFRPSDLVLYFTSSTNFRKELDSNYKGKRNKRKPCGYRSLLDYCRENYHCREIENLEADDVLGIDCHRAPGDFILISPDKDFKQIACRQFDPLTGKQRTVTPKDADAFFYRQILTGDPVDGYKGLPGVGEVKASAILNKGKADLWGAVVTAYEAAGLTIDDAIHQARLARILRPGEYDFATGKPILWNPPQKSPAP